MKSTDEVLIEIEDIKIFNNRKKSDCASLEETYWQGIKHGSNEYPIDNGHG